MNIYGGDDEIDERSYLERIMQQQTAKIETVAEAAELSITALTYVLALARVLSVTEEGIIRILALNTAEERYIALRLLMARKKINSYTELVALAEDWINENISADFSKYEIEKFFLMKTMPIYPKLAHIIDAFSWGDVDLQDVLVSYYKSDASDDERSGKDDE